MLSIHLANIKSSGVYRFVFDKSIIPGEELTTIRLVVGYSEKGPFNTVTYVKNASEFTEIYGGISKKLEKYGCYFHRVALQCVAKEPILCLNLKDFSDETVSGVSFDFCGDIDLNDAVKDLAVESLFDTTRLWTLSPEALPSAFTAGDIENDKYISLALTDTAKCSSTVYMRPSLVRGYDISLRDWYNSYNGGEYPDYMENYLNTLVSDYLVDLYIFKGQFTNEIASSPTFVNYFNFDGDMPVVKDYIVNSYGEKKDALQALSEVEGSGFVVRYTGSLLPYFKNADNSWLSIDLQVNNNTTSHSVMMFLNEEILENASANDEQLAIVMSKINLGGYNNEDWESLGNLNDARYGTCMPAVYEYNLWRLAGSDENKAWELDPACADFTYGDPAVDIFAGIFNKDTASDSQGYFTYASNGLDIYADAASTPISLNDRFIAADGQGLATVINIEPMADGVQNKYTFNTPVLVAAIGGENAIIRYNHKLTAHAGVLSTVESYKWEKVEGELTEELKAAYTDEYVDVPSKADLKAVKDDVYYVSVADASSVLYSNGAHTGVYLKGYEYGAIKPKDSTMASKIDWINKKLDVLAKKGIREALTNCTDTDYRYIIDSFEAFPEDGLRGRLSALAKDKQNAFVISNFPSVKSFTKVPGGAFLDDHGIFNTKYIVSGHNKSKNSLYNISLPSEFNGASFIAFYTPLKVMDNGIKIDMPAAGVVSNNFMDKYTTRKPYSVVAGPYYGNMYCEGLVGPDYNFTREDLDNLEPMGVNCMVYKPQRGTFINSNQTAKQHPVTGLSKINVRELVIYLQDEIALMLQGHQWELNTQSLRDAIKTKADNICENIKSNGGLYKYINVCDESNNTPEVIDNEMVVLSTSIEPAKGAGKMVHELTIYRTGGMSSMIK